MDGTEIRLTSGSLAKTSELIRSLRDDEQVKSRDGECTMFVHFPKTVRTQWFEKSADVGPIGRNGSRSHSGGVPGGVGKAQSA